MDIHKVLEEIPAKIATTSYQAEELRFKWNALREKLRKDEAKLALRLKGSLPDLKATEIKDMVTDDVAIHATRMEALKAETDYRVKEAEMNSLDDEFTACKMKARLIISEMKL